MSHGKSYDFFRALLFGKTNYEIPPTDINVKKLILDCASYIDVENTIKNGGLLLSTYVLRNDLDNIIKYLRQGNDRYYNGLNKSDFRLKLKTEVGKYFFNELSSVCRGDLESGLTSNSAIKKDIVSKKECDELDEIIKNKLPRPSFSLEKFNISNKMFQNVLKLYDIKCKSIGKILDPFSMVLTPQNSFVDPVHWETTESLKHFIKYYSDNYLAKSVKQLIFNSVMAILNADEQLLPEKIHNEQQIKKFIENINVIHNYIEKVDTNNTPPKLIDVFQRLLALVQLDKIWISEHIKPEASSIQCFLCNLYVKNLELENENKLLRISLNQS